MGTVIGHGLPLSADPEATSIIRHEEGKHHERGGEREREREGEGERQRQRQRQKHFTQTQKQKDRQTATSRHANRKLREGVRGCWGRGTGGGERGERSKTVGWLRGGEGGGWRGEESGEGGRVTRVVSL